MVTENKSIKNRVNLKFHLRMLLYYLSGHSFVVCANLAVYPYLSIIIIIQNSKVIIF